MSALIGTRHIVISDQGRFIDAPSIVRIADHAVGKKIVPLSIATPSMPVDSGKYPPKVYAKSVAAFKRRLSNSNLKRARTTADDAEFKAAHFVVATTKLGNTSSERVMMEVRSGSGEHLYADVISGCLFEVATGRCKSTEQLRVVGTRECTLAERKKIISSKRKDVNGED